MCSRTDDPTTYDRIAFEDRWPDTERLREDAAFGAAWRRCEAAATAIGWTIEDVHRRDSGWEVEVDHFETRDWMYGRGASIKEALAVTTKRLEARAAR